MKTIKVICTLLIAIVMIGANAQEPRSKVKIVDNGNKSTIVYNTTPSSSKSCQAGDFPVYRDASLTEVDFRELQKIIIRPDVPARVDSSYISVEMITKDGKSQVYEMAKTTRFIGDTDDGSFSVKVMDVKTLEVVQ